MTSSVFLRGTLIAALVHTLKELAMEPSVVWAGLNRVERAFEAQDISATNVTEGFKLVLRQEREYSARLSIPSKRTLPPRTLIADDPDTVYNLKSVQSDAH